MTGIISLGIVPLRTSDSETSEMTSQLLFGEQVEILETGERWLTIRNLSDNYEGWVDRKMVRILSKTEETYLKKAKKAYIPLPAMKCFVFNSAENMILPGGSIIYELENGRFKLNENIYELNTAEIQQLKESASANIIEIAKQYLNAPYLWGGKSIFGIDCSGLVQVVCSVIGVQLPRDASQQVECGKVIDFLTEAQSGDLAFFENIEGKIIHVGILINSTQLIHASGWVKIEQIDTHGIVSAQTGEYTHKLRVIKRIL